MINHRNRCLDGMLFKASLQTRALVYRTSRRVTPNVLTSFRSSTMQHASAAAPAGPHQGSANRLQHEQSPYLLQHQYNPVEWYPWGPEALEKAKKEDKPIFLSVGYSACHWCHVMERESFEDQETADILNKDFVSIKVDREERPDVDRLYMTYVQAISGRGGWPMSVWLTPDLDPIYGGTYYPKKDMMQGGALAMPSFTTVLRRLANLWQTSREDLKAKGTSVMSQLRQSLESEVLGAGEQLEPDVAAHAITTCAEQLGKRFDSQLGGFGGAPKFPRPSEINALLAAYAHLKSRNNQAEADKALHMAIFSLDKMAMGGMYDHIGGGFHRYSVDEFWHVPHFEKMLYDNPPLAQAYLSAFQITGRHSYALVARGVLDYLKRDMTAKQGGIYSAEDADSYNPEAGHKTEGYFYIWTWEEVQDVLGQEAAQLFCDAYNIKPGGNCTLSPMSDPHKEFQGRSVPILLQTLEELAAKRRMTLDEVETQLASCRRTLHGVRSRRPRPALDDKMVCAWNGMAVSAFAHASRVLSAEAPPAKPLFPVEGCPRSDYLAAAQTVAQFVRRELWDGDSATLKRSYCRTASVVQGFADDYANLIQGCLDLYEAGGGLEWLQWAERLQRRLDELFWDAAGGGYFSTSTLDPSIKMRIKDSYDGAEPTASSVAASNLFRLAALLPARPATPQQPLSQPQQQSQAGSVTTTATATAATTATSAEHDEPLTHMDRAERTLAAFQERLFGMPVALTHMCSAALLKLRSPLRQVILGVGGAAGGGLTGPAAQALLDAMHVPHAPDKAIIIIDLADNDSVEFWKDASPEALAMVQSHFTRKPGAGPTAFVCQNFTCQAPTEDPSKLMELLRSGGAPAVPPQPLSGLPGM